MSDKEKTVIVVALAGNPNSGKTTMFNEITGSRQHVGNYPGVTVERKEGSRTHKGRAMTVVDLPGTYSLTAYSEEELLARNFIVDERPQVVVDVVDSSNLERNLYLAVQIMELGAPLVLAFNMDDVAKARGMDYDTGKLASLLGVRIVRTVGSKGQGIGELLDAVSESADERGARARPPIAYGREVEEEIRTIRSALEKAEIPGGYDIRWLALKLLEGDGELTARIGDGKVLETVARCRARLRHATGEEPETTIASARYGYIAGALQECTRSTLESRITMSDRIDSVVTSRFMGIPLFLGMMYLVFQLTFTIGDPFMGWIEEFFGWAGDTVTGFWPEGSDSLLKSLLVDGVIGGVGGVIIFLPNILLLFLAIAILEDSGYMARAAFIMDRLMHKIGLHGKSFIPMLIGFGCSVPAIMATRTLDNRRDRLVTMLVVPLMSCGARLPIYALIIPAFFPEVWHAPMLWIIYLTGIVLAVVCAKLLRMTILSGGSVPFVMELPPYRMPTLKGILIHMWERGALYLRKAGTIVLGISILLWALAKFPELPEGRAAVFAGQREAVEVSHSTDEEMQAALADIDNAQAEAELEYSAMGRIGHFIAPVLRPIGFDWKIGTAAIAAFAAKEVYVAQLGIVYSVGEADEESESLREKLARNYSPLVGLGIMLFGLISAPCMVTIAVTKRESNSWKWALFQLIGLTLLAYVVTLAVYQIGSALGLGTGGAL
jgi:ferrous iron transport protein B